MTVLRSLLPAVLLPTALAVVVLIPDAARAQTYQLLGPGTQSCGTWIAQRRTPTGWVQFSDWVEGFLSGVGYIGGEHGFDPLQGVDANGLNAWLDNYCHAHPLKKLVNAARAFVAEHPHQ